MRTWRELKEHYNLGIGTEVKYLRCSSLYCEAAHEGDSFHHLFFLTECRSIQGEKPVSICSLASSVHTEDLQVQVVQLLQLSCRFKKLITCYSSQLDKAFLHCPFL